MGERRMFSKAVTQNDMFLDMPLSTQAVYFHLGMEADDDGFIGSANRILRSIGATKDDFNLLIAKGFVIPFQDGVCVVRHWRIHNYIRSDRYKETIYKTHKSMLGMDENKAYELLAAPAANQLTTAGIPTDCQTVYQLETQDKVSKDKLSKENKRSHSCRPSLEEVRAYCLERENNIDPEAFVDFYASKGWKVGSQPMKDWQAAVRQWERRQNDSKQKAAPLREEGFLTMGDLYGNKKG